MTDILLIRHAEAEGNSARRIHGTYDALLTTRGYGQVALLRRALENERIDAVYASDLFRARRTASAAAAPRGLDVALVPELRERDFGEFEDLPFAAAQKRIADWGLSMWNLDSPGGELRERARARFTDALRRIAREKDGGSVAVFAHGHVIALFLCELLGIAPGGGEIPLIGNTSVTRLEYRGGRFHIVSMGDAAHLPPPDSYVEKRGRLKRLPGQDSFNMDVLPLGGGTFASYLGETETGRLYLAQGADHGLLSRIEMLPQWSGLGLGIQLVGQAASHFRAAGLNHMRIIDHEGAETFFADAGFMHGEGFMERAVSVPAEDARLDSVHGEK
ncbi:MAG: histidine phosphatase family protein [Oscillospiraceae bacterium]|jgi:probable phosphoglycerate mutase|nr:histidine phosphatase family protein [Oscillospiraceae bacterium]